MALCDFISFTENFEKCDILCCIQHSEIKFDLIVLFVNTCMTCQFEIVKIVVSCHSCASKIKLEMTFELECGRGVVLG